MRSLRSGPDFLSGRAWWRERGGTFQADRLAADHFQPGPPNAEAAASRCPCTEAEAHGELASAVGGDESEREEESGQSTALTRRGLSVVLLS